MHNLQGTEDDLPLLQNRFQRVGCEAGIERSAIVGAGSFSRSHNNMESQIHNFEQDAYSSVLRAFKAQSDAITWEKESLITELRKELRVSDEEHRELLSRVNADDIIRRIREWRKVNAPQPGLVTAAAQSIHDGRYSPSVSGSRKKQKSSQSVASLAQGAPSPVMHLSTKRHASASRQGPPAGGRVKNSTSLPSAFVPGRGQVSNGGSAGAIEANEHTNVATSDSFVGRKIWTRWPEDNHFYEAVITDYDPVKGRHALVYDINTAAETWEWVNLKEISPEDICWDAEDPNISRRSNHPVSGRGMKKQTTQAGVVTGAGRGRGATKGHPKKGALSSSGIGKKIPGEIEILHTDTLIKEVEKVFVTSHPDPLEMEQAKKALRDHEQALVDAITSVENASDGESGNN